MTISEFKEMILKIQETPCELSTISFALHHEGEVFLLDLEKILWDKPMIGPVYCALTININDTILLRDFQRARISKKPKKTKSKRKI